MTCLKLSKPAFLLSLLLALSLPLATLLAEDQQPQSLPTLDIGLENLPQTMQNTELKVIELPFEFWQSWESFKTGFQAFNLSLETYLDQVEAFGISFEELPVFMTHLTESYKVSEASRLEEREASIATIYQVERSRNIWRIASVVLGLGFIIVLF